MGGCHARGTLCLGTDAHGAHQHGVVCCRARFAGGYLYAIAANGLGSCWHGFARWWLGLRLQRMAALPATIAQGAAHVSRKHAFPHVAASVRHNAFTARRAWMLQRSHSFPMPGIGTGGLANPSWLPT